MCPAEAASELLRRRSARKKLIDFIRYMNPDYVVSGFALSVCEELESFYRAVVAGDRPILIIQAPPQHGKSEIVSRNLPAWLFGKNPEFKIGGLSYGKDLATDMNRDIQRIMMSEEYARIFPCAFLNSKRVVTVEVEPKRNSETFELMNHSGRYIAQGVGGPLTGKQLDIGIIDDPIKNAQEALSQTVKDAVWNWYISTFLTRMSKYSGQIIMATRWATDDLSGRVLESNRRAKVVSFPAISESGDALVPELHPIEKLIETKATISDHFWSAMYQQSPKILGGGMFKDHWWQYYETLPRIVRRVIYADTALKTGQANDYSVLQCWGVGADGRIYLIDQIRGKWESPELLVMSRAFWNKHKAESSCGPLRSMKVEDKASGTGLIQQLKRETPSIPVQPIPRATDKITRAMDVLPSIECGNVVLPQNAPWLGDFVSEASSFPNGRHDDQIDPMMDAINDLILSVGGMNYSALVVS